MHRSFKSIPGWLFFDLDGTIADSLPGIEFSIQEAFAAVGRTISVKDVRRFVGSSIRTILRNMEPSLTDSELELMAVSYRQSYDTTGCFKTILYPGVRETLDLFLSNGSVLFIVTNKPKLPTANILGELGITNSFREMVSPDSRTPSFNSKGEMLIDLITRYSVDLRMARMIGDTADDMQAAREAGVAFVHSAYGYGTLQESEIDTIHQFSALPSLCGY